MSIRTLVFALGVLAAGAGSLHGQTQAAQPRPDAINEPTVDSHFEQHDARSIALQERMKADLERLRTAQERYWSEMRFYADTLSMMERFRPRSGAVFRLHDVKADGWSVEITHASLPGGYIRATIVRPRR